MFCIGFSKKRFDGSSLAVPRATTDDPFFRAMRGGSKRARISKGREGVRRFCGILAFLPHGVPAQPLTLGRRDDEDPIARWLRRCGPPAVSTKQAPQLITYYLEIAGILVRIVAKGQVYMLFTSCIST
jgi:hypothetical protein